MEKRIILMNEQQHPLAKKSEAVNAINIGTKIKNATGGLIKDGFYALIVIPTLYLLGVSYYEGVLGAFSLEFSAVSLSTLKLFLAPFQTVLNITLGYPIIIGVLFICAFFLHVVSFLVRVIRIKAYDSDRKVLKKILRNIRASSNSTFLFDDKEVDKQASSLGFSMIVFLVGAFAFSIGISSAHNHGKRDAIKIISSCKEGKFGYSLVENEKVNFCLRLESDAIWFSPKDSLFYLEKWGDRKIELKINVDNVVAANKSENSKS